MLEGMTLLATNHHMSVVTMLIVIVTGSICTLTMLATAAAIDKREFEIVLLGCFITVLMISATYAAYAGMPKRTEYKVLINENINFVEFYSQYDVAYTEGNIWAIHKRGE